MEEKKGFFGALFDLSFSDFITTRIIKLLYVLAIVAGAVFGLMTMFSGFASNSGAAGVLGVILAPVVFLVYVILARVSLELTIVLFKIAENVTGIAESKKQS